MRQTTSRRWRRLVGAILLGASLLVGCGGNQDQVPSTPTPTIAPVVTALPATATAVPPTPTALPPSTALAQLNRDVDSRTADADRQNAAIEARLNAGTTLPPLLPALTAAATADQRAAAAISMLPLPPPLDAYRAIAQYQAATAAGYGTLAEAWSALARAAQGNGDETMYQALAGQATDRFHTATVAKAAASIALGLAPEGSVPDG
jgi:hypothetical protein